MANRAVEDTKAVAGDAVGAGASPGQHDQLGERIAALLNVAEAAAEQIRADAREEAERLLAEATTAAVQRSKELTRDAEELHAKAETHWREAQERAERTIAQAEQDALGRRTGADEDARRTEEAALARRAEIEGEIHALLERRARALDGTRRAMGELRTTVSELDTLLEEMSPDNASADAAPADTEQPHEGLLGRLRLRGKGEAKTTGAAPGSGPAADVYDTLKGSVEKVGGRWVPRDETAAPTAGAQAKQAPPGKRSPAGKGGPANGREE